ncbi:MAG: ferritin [Ignavibacteriae bacterium]|nr:ferritin [Ignavibacteriota bacterium]
MQLSKSMLKALNEQVTHEFYAAHLYLSMSAHFESSNLPGFARWMQLQSKEENGHAMKIYKYIHERNDRVTLDAIDKPPTEFKKPLDVMKQALEHEKKVSGLINNLYEMAVKEKDYPTQVMLQWFITEQVEEEKTASDIIELLKQVGDAPAGLIMLDRQLGARAGE